MSIAGRQDRAPDGIVASNPAGSPAGNPAGNQVLAGCVVLITADRRATDLAFALQRRGALIRHAPALTIVAHQHDEMLIASTKALLRDPPDVVVLTTGIGLRGWMEAADAAGLASDLAELLRSVRVVARGPKANGALQAAGVIPDWVAESETAQEIAEVMLGEGVAGLHIAVQYHGAGADGLDERFVAAGARVTSLIVYRWGPPPDPSVLVDSVHECANRHIDAVTFTSAPGAHAWLAAARREGALDRIVERTLGGGLVAAAVGPVTAGPLRDVGIDPLVPERGRLGALVRALVSHYEELQSAAVVTVGGPLIVHSTAAVLGSRTLALSRGALDVLRLLAQARGDVVSRHQVLAALKTDSQDLHTAEVAVARLREAMGVKGVIETVVKRGYRLGVRV